MLKFGLLILFLTLSTFYCKKPKNYCYYDLCYGTKNTGCQNSGKFVSSCPKNVRIIKLNQTQKQQCVDVHNAQRVLLSKGSFRNSSGFTFPPAARMMAQQWDEEQAVMASLQLRTCASHDPCHNTYYDHEEEFPIFSGQNIYWSATYGPEPTTEYIIRRAIEEWFIEYLDTGVDVVTSVYLKPVYKTGHFIVAAFDANSRLGCALSRWNEPENEDGDILKKIQFTCNYFETVFGGDPLYEVGAPCSGRNCRCNAQKLCEDDPKTFVETYVQVLEGVGSQFED